MIALWRAADREQLGELGDRVVSVPNELEDVDALAGAELGLLAFELAVGAGDRHPFAGAQVRWTRSRALELGGQFPALRGRGPCLLLCSCSMPPDGDARPRRCRSFTPAGRPGTRVSATRPTRRRSRRSSRLCAKAGHARYGNRLNGLIVVLWRAGLRINEALSLTETDLEEQRGSILVRHGKNDRRRQVGMDAWGWSALGPVALGARDAAVGPLSCAIAGPTRGHSWSAGAARLQLHQITREAGVRRRFAPHQLRHAHAVELLREGIPLPLIQRQLGHSHLSTTGTYLQGISSEEIISTVHARRAPMMHASAGLAL